MTIVKTLGKGQVVIPKRVREYFHIHQGKRLALRVEDTYIILQPLPDDPIKSLRGILKGKGPSTSDLLKSRKEERLREKCKLTRFLRSH